jgi:hypothetical protein
MHEPRDSSPGTFLGWIAVLGGILWLGLGLAYVWKGQAPDGVDGLVFGGLAFVAGCVILYRRARMGKIKQNDSGQAGPDAGRDGGSQ